MGPDWKFFIDRLIGKFNSDPKRDWTGERIATFIKDEEIKFLERVLMKLDKEEEM